MVKSISEEEYKERFDKLLERMELCINNHADYFEHLIKPKFELSLVLFRLQNFWSDLSM